MPSRPSEEARSVIQLLRVRVVATVVLDASQVEEHFLQQAMIRVDPVCDEPAEEEPDAEGEGQGGLRAVQAGACRRTGSRRGTRSSGRSSARTSRAQPVRRRTGVRVQQHSESLSTRVPDIAGARSESSATRRSTRESAGHSDFADGEVKPGGANQRLERVRAVGDHGEPHERVARERSVAGRRIGDRDLEYPSEEPGADPVPVAGGRPTVPRLGKRPDADDDVCLAANDRCDRGSG